MPVLENIEPKSVFHFFEEISSIPRASHDMQGISDYCVEFAKSRGLEYRQDELLNVIIKKTGTKGYENSAPVILQGHMDMVCVKRSDSNHDFTKDTLKLAADNGYVYSIDTSLGGDDGIAVAYALALLDSNDIAHPPIEAVFTVNEEDGMDGAAGIDFSYLNGRALINFDSELEGVLTVGCAGGVRCDSTIYEPRKFHQGVKLTIEVGSLCGGHSGTAIHLQRGNANKLMGRLLDAAYNIKPFNLICINGGERENVIAGSCCAEILVKDKKTAAKIRDKVLGMQDIFDREFMDAEPNLFVKAETGDEVSIPVFAKKTTKKVISYIMICPNGVLSYSRSFADLVETSANMGTVRTHDKGISFTSLARSISQSQLDMLREVLVKCASVIGAEFIVNSEYPAWPYDPSSKLLEVMKDVYTRQYGREPEISAVHAGLECGLLKAKCPDLDCISIGPNILDIHSYNERLEIASVKRVWDFLLETLKCLK